MARGEMRSHAAGRAAPPSTGAGECADEARFLARPPGSRQKSSGQAEACPQSSKVRFGEQEPIKDSNRADRLHNQLEPSVLR
jgi:hypothetical protein